MYRKHGQGMIICSIFSIHQFKSFIWKIWGRGLVLEWMMQNKESKGWSIGERLGESSHKTKDWKSIPNNHARWCQRQQLVSFKSAYSNTCKYTTVCMYTKLQVQVSLALCMTKWLGQHRRPLFSLKYEVRGERLRSSQNVYPLCRGMDAKACQSSQIPGILIGSTKGEYTQCFED